MAGRFLPPGRSPIVPSSGYNPVSALVNHLQSDLTSPAVKNMQFNDPRQGLAQYLLQNVQAFNPQHLAGAMNLASMFFSGKTGEPMDVPEGTPVPAEYAASMARANARGKEIQPKFVPDHALPSFQEHVARTDGPFLAQWQIHGPGASDGLQSVVDNQALTPAAKQILIQYLASRRGK